MLRFAPGARLVVRTRAKGLLGKLAHDLELHADALDGEVELAGDGFRGKLSFRAPLRVEGVLKGERLDRGVLSASDRADIEGRMRKDVFRGVERVEVSFEGANRTRGTALVRLGGPSTSVGLDLRVRDVDGSHDVKGTAKVSLSRLGVPEIKGPLGAFKVADEVEVELVGILSSAAPA